MNESEKPSAGDAAGPLAQAQASWSKAMPSTDVLKGKWRQQLGAAKLTWGKLTDDELMKLEGHAEKLTGLIQERYALTRDAAARQVKNFFDQYSS
jgi:uncharacterized protein YjbJ (UPF0337 family)